MERLRVARREPVWAFGALLLAATVVLSLAAPYVAQRKVDEAVAKRDPDLAAQAHSWNPVSILPLLTEAAIEEQLGDKRKARQLYREAVSTQPENPDAWIELGLFELDAANDPCSAFRALSTAYRLDRYDPASPWTAARSTVRAPRPSETGAVRGLVWNSGASGDGTDQAAEFERPQFVLAVVRAAVDRAQMRRVWAAIQRWRSFTSSLC